MDTNEEFAKLDALLADLLSEVEQPILLNQDGLTNWDSYYKTKNSNKCEILKNLDDIERSVDYLNEQKEKLKKQDLYYEKDGVRGKDIIFEEDNESLNFNQPFRKIKSKFDYYISKSNDQNPENSSNKILSSCMNSDSLNKIHKPSNYSPGIFNTNEQNNLIINHDNKPPISPNSKFTPRNENFQIHQSNLSNFQNFVSNLNLN